MYFNAMTAQVGQGKLAEATRTVGLLLQRTPGNPIGLYMRACLAGARRDFDGPPAEARGLAQATPDPPWQAGAAGTLAGLSLVRGALALGEAPARGGTALDETR